MKEPCLKKYHCQREGDKQREMSKKKITKKSEKQSRLRYVFHDYFWKYRWLHLFILPAVVYFIIFKYIPMGGIIIAFKNYKGGAGGFAAMFSAEWVGFDHFLTFFKSSNFIRVVSNTLIISLYRLIFSFPAPIILAILLNEIHNSKFKRTVQTITYLPYFLSWVVIGGILSSLLSTDGGVINAALKIFNIEPIGFLTDERFFRGVLVISDVWKNLGYNSIIYLAAITGINEELYEAARIDGANRFAQMRYITLPGIGEIVAVMLILTVGTILNDNFEQIYNLYSPAVYSVSDTFETFTYRVGIQNAKFSYATAIGLLKSVIALVLVLFSNRAAKKFGSEGLM